MMFALVAALNASYVTSDWLDMAAKRADQEAIAWVKQQLHEEIHKDPVLAKGMEKETVPDMRKKCLTTVNASNNVEVPVYVMISFSVPEETWVSLSAEMEKVGAVFVLRGLPNNSFKELSKRLQRLSSIGVNAEVRIDPMLYTTYKIDKAPTFLIIEKDFYHILSGNVSLSYAMEAMATMRWKK